MERVNPEDVGLSTAGLERAQAGLQAYIDSSKVAGAVAVVARGEQIAFLECLGKMDTESNETLRPDTIFRTCSLTKIITSVAALMLVEEGRLRLDDPVTRWIPAFGDLRVADSSDASAESAAAGGGAGQLRTKPLERPITVADLLTHTSGIGSEASQDSPVGALYRKARLRRRGFSLATMVERLAELPLFNQPGECWRYGASTDVLGYLIERASGRKLDALLEERIFRPLGMHDTAFDFPQSKRHRVASVYGLPRNGELPLLRLGVESLCALRSDLLLGGSGLASTALDYLTFAQMLLGGGETSGVRLLSEQSVRLMTTNRLASHVLPYALPWTNLHHYTRGCGFGLGVRVVQDVEQWGVLGSEGEYGWAGAANTFLWIDPKERLITVLFMQSMPFMHYPIDREFKNWVYQARR